MLPKTRALIFVAALTAATGTTISLAQNITVESAPDWDAMFDRTSGWTGADGIYAIPLSGVDAFGSAANTPTLFIFSDTFIGNVNENGERMSGTTLVNNTMALMTGIEPDPDHINFYWGRNDQGDPAAILVPESPDAEPGDWYWFQDGVSLNGKIYIFGLRMREGDGGLFNFAVDGVNLISAPVNADHPLEEQVQVDTPLFWTPDDERGDIYYGTSVMVNTQEAGAPHPDGYVYIYGTQNDPLIKRLLVARVMPAHFEDFSAWRYWDGHEWGQSIEAAAPLIGRVSSELSVSPLPNGKFVLAYQQDALGREVAIRIGESPVGPFGPSTPIWTCPEPKMDPNGDIFVYNAKAHPHLSRPGELLISYNVNTFDFWDHFRYADIYRPRFIRVRLGQ